MDKKIKAEDFKVKKGDYAAPDKNADANFGTVNEFMLDYIPENDVYKTEYINRDGIYNTLYKLHKGEDVKIAYIGGSITQQDTWRVFTTKWFRESYKSNITEIEIGLAGTGADLAVCRIEKEILSKEPDLIFIEYAVNGGRDCDMEGMVRKIYKQNKKTDICFVYTTTVDAYPVYSEGKLPKYASIYEEVANFYKIPTVFFANQAFDLYEQGKLTLSSSTVDEGKILYTTDGVHMTADGGQIAAGSIARSVLNMEKSFDFDNYQIKDHFIPSGRLSKMNFENANYSDDWNKIKFNGEWFKCENDQSGGFSNFDYSDGYMFMFKKLFQSFMGTKKAGSSFTVKFLGTDIGLFEAGGQYSGQLKVIVDGKPSEQKLMLYNKYYDSKLRHQYYFIPSLPYGEHTVEFILDDEMPDKSMLEGQFPNDIELYRRNELYVARILYNGELLNANK